MTVACRNEKCYYFDRGFCSNELTAIDQNGMCETVWYRGQPKQQVEKGNRVPIHILNVVKKENVDTEIPKIEESTENN